MIAFRNRYLTMYIKIFNKTNNMDRDLNAKLLPAKSGPIWYIPIQFDEICTI